MPHYVFLLALFFIACNKPDTAPGPDQAPPLALPESQSRLVALGPSDQVLQNFQANLAGDAALEEIFIFKPNGMMDESSPLHVQIQGPKGEVLFRSEPLLDAKKYIRAQINDVTGDRKLDLLMSAQAQNGGIAYYMFGLLGESIAQLAAAIEVKESAITLGRDPGQRFTYAIAEGETVVREILAVRQSYARDNLRMSIMLRLRQGETPEIFSWVQVSDKIYLSKRPPRHDAIAEWTADKTPVYDDAWALDEPTPCLRQGEVSTCTRKSNRDIRSFMGGHKDCRVLELSETREFWCFPIGLVREEKLDGTPIRDMENVIVPSGEVLTPEQAEALQKQASKQAQ